ncbi:MAG: hypothetical protein IPM98_17285 [Lewinellaceae bacterium]|nr:hypothetical protein [Lewinellaceae bacterium]
MDDYEKQQFLKSWEARHRLGKAPFVLRTAALFVVIVFVLLVLLDLFDQPFADALSSNLMPRKLISKVIVGVLLGFLNWYLMERQYRKLQEEK